MKINLHESGKSAVGQGRVHRGRAAVAFRSPSSSALSAPSVAISFVSLAPIRVCLLLGFCLLAGCAKKQPAEVSLGTCLAELTNTMAFCERPVGKQHLISTYDRTGGNSDWRSFQRHERVDGRYVMADLEGPGCVSRFWCTGIGENCTLYFFLDGEKDPFMKGPPSELFGKTGLFRPPLSHFLSGAYYSYVPMPFAKSFRVEISGPITPESRLYYQINYETYAEGTTVRSFPRALSAADSNLWEAVRSGWMNQTDASAADKSACSPLPPLVVQPGHSADWLTHKGPGLLKTFWIGMSAPPDAGPLARSRQLREVVLRIFWDGSTEPSVEAPIGDFFCNGQYRRRFASLPVAVLEDSFVCRFPMPFRKGARIRISNDGPVPVTIAGGVDLRAGVERRRQVNYFHARWNRGVSLGQPLPLLRVKGRGHYVGCYLTATGTDGSWNLLEGDESIRLDGEINPSMHGTGLEDYFNGGWYYNGLFERPLHGLVEKAAMRTSQYRFHIPDRIGFDKGLTLDFEFGDANRAAGYMSGVAYWYQTNPRPVGAGMPSVAERFVPPDQIDAASFMTGLFELERIGHYDEAAERCLLFGEKYAGHPFVPLLRLRAIAYRELTGGYAAVRGDYESIARDVPESEAGRQAKALLWYQSASSNALAAAHSNMKVKVYLGGRPIFEGADPRALVPLLSLAVLPPGEHEIAAEVTPLCQGPWFSFHLRTHWTNMMTDATWECSQVRPTNWPMTGDPGVVWTNIVSAQNDLPKMGWWQFIPNGFVNIQSGKRLIEPAWNGWDRQPYQTTYLRKRFVVPAPQNTDHRPQTADGE